MQKFARVLPLSSITAERIFTKFGIFMLVTLDPGIGRVFILSLAQYLSVSGFGVHIWPLRCLRNVS